MALITIIDLWLTYLLFIQQCYYLHIHILIICTFMECMIFHCYLKFKMSFLKTILASLIACFFVTVFQNPTVVYNALEVSRPIVSNYYDFFLYVLSNSHVVTILVSYLTSKYFSKTVYISRGKTNYIAQGHDHPAGSYLADDQEAYGESSSGLLGGMTPDSSVSSDMSSSSTVIPDAPSRKMIFGGSACQTQVAPTIAAVSCLDKEVPAGHYSTPMFVGSFPVASTLAIGSDVCFINSNAIYTNNNIKRLFIDKRFASFDIRYTINITGNPFASGNLIFANVPCPLRVPTSMIDQDPAIDETWTNVLNRIVALDHVIIDLSVDGVYTVDMPYTHHSDCLDWKTYSSTPTYAALWGIVLAPYIPPTGSTTALNFEVYATVMNLKTIESAPYYAQGLLSFGGTTNNSYQISDIKDSNLPLNVSGDHISGTVDGAFGLDNPSIPSNPSNFIQNVYQKFVSWKNAVDVVKIAGQPEKVVTFSSKMSKALRLCTDEMSMEFIRSRWAYTGSFQVSSSTANNSCIYVDTIDSFFAPSTVSAFGVNTFASMNMHISNSMRYWRGSINYRFVLASNSFKRGKLLFAIHYGDNAAVPTGPIVTGSLDPRSLPHLIVDISNVDRVVDVEIPYKSMYEVLRTRDMNVPFGSLNPFNEFVMGSIAVYLISPIQPSNGTSPLVNVSVFCKPGNDFRYYDQAPSSATGYCSQSILAPCSKVQSAETRLNHMSCLSSLKEFLLRPVPYGNYLIPGPARTIGSSTAPASPMIVPFHPQFLTNDAHWSTMMQSYCGMRGGWRAIIKCNFSNALQGQVRISALQQYTPINAANVFSGTNQQFIETAAVLDSSYSTEYPYSGSAVQITEMATNQIPLVMYGGAPGAVVGNQQTFGYVNPADTYVDSYAQPETVVEFTDPSLIYTTQPVGNVLPAHYIMGTTLQPYSPNRDRNVPFLVFQSIDNTSVPTDEYNNNYGITVFFQAADDLRFFWYNGGPGALNPQSTGVVLTGTSYTYYAPMGH